MFRCLIPSAILTSINFQFIAFFVGQNITLPFVISNLVGTLSCIGMGYCIVYIWNIPLYIFPLTQFLFSVINFVAVSKTFAKNIKKEDLKSLTKKEIFEDILGFSYNGVKFIMSMLVSCIGWNLMTFDKKLMQGEVYLNAFSSLKNFTVFTWLIAISLGDVSRINMGNLIGQKRYIQTKNSQYFYQIVTVAVGVILIYVVFRVRSLFVDYDVALDEAYYNCLMYSFSTVSHLLMIYLWKL